jgi:hypothetical protein
MDRNTVGSTRSEARMNQLDSWLRDTYTEHRFQKAERIPHSKKQMDAFMLVLAAISIALFVYEFITPIAHSWLNGISVTMDIVFLCDYMLRVYHSGAQGGNGFRWSKASNHYVSRWYGIVDWVAVFPPLLTHVFHFGLGVDEFSRVSRFLRVARMTRVLRVLRTLRLVQASERMSESLQNYHRKISRELRASLLLVLLTMIVGVAGIYLFESGTESKYKSIGDTLRWSVLSIMGQTEGLDFSTWYSKSIAVFIIFIGIAFFGIVAGSITTFFMDNMSKHMQGLSKYDGNGHIIICGWNSKLSELLQHLRKVPDLKVVILLFNRGNPEEDMSDFDRLQNPHTGDYLTVFWIRGNPRNTDDLKRANVLGARSIIVLSDYSKSNLDEDDIDARSLMSLEMIHEIKEDAKWTARSDEAVIGDAEVTVELLTVQSIPLARKYASHVVYADDLICQYITLDTQSREAGQVYERLIDPTDQNAYLIDITPLDPLPVNERVLAIEERLRTYSSLFLGIYISDAVFTLLAKGNKHFYDLIKQSDLLEAAEELLKRQYGVSLLRYVENPPETLERRNGSKNGFPILNPIARKELIDYVLANCSGGKFEAGDVKAIGMSSSFPRGLEL